MNRCKQGKGGSRGKRREIEGKVGGMGMGWRGGRGEGRGWKGGKGIEGEGGRGRGN